MEDRKRLVSTIYVSIAAWSLVAIAQAQAFKVDTLPVSFRSNPDQFDVPAITVTPLLAQDMDGDGHIDVVCPSAVVNGNLGLVILWNRGNSTFDPVLVPLPVGPPYYGGVPRGLALGDVNGDGLVDILVSQNGRFIDPYPPMVFLQTATRAFQYSASAFNLSLSIGSLGVRLLDVDGDGDLDALFFGINSASSARTD